MPVHSGPEGEEVVVAIAEHPNTEPPSKMVRLAASLTHEVH